MIVFLSIEFIYEYIAIVEVLAGTSLVNFMRGIGLLFLRATLSVFKSGALSQTSLQYNGYYLTDQKLVLASFSLVPF